MFSKIAVSALFAGLVAAQSSTLPNGDPVNPLSAPQNNIVPACKPYTVKWAPNTAGPMRIQLLIGAVAKDLVPGKDIATGIPNSGSFVWTSAPGDLNSTNGAVVGYGLKLIDIPTGLFQYTSQFGVDTSGCGAVSSSSTSSSTSATTPGGYSVVPKPTPSGYPVSVPVYSSSTKSSSAPGYSATAPANTTVIAPTVPSTLEPSATATTSKPSIPQVSGNAAAALQAGAGLIGAAAAIAFML